MSEYNGFVYYICWKAPPRLTLKPFFLNPQSNVGDQRSTCRLRSSLRFRGVKEVINRSHASSNFKCCGREFDPVAPNQPVYTRRAMASQPPTYLSGFGFFLPTYTSPHFLPTTLRSDHVKQIPTTQGARGCYLGLECGHRRNESRKGNLKHHARKGRF